jgi:Domain of unknown function (DUF4281)
MTKTKYTNLLFTRYLAFGLTFFGIFWYIETSFVFNNLINVLMSPEKVFKVVNAVAILPWLLMMIIPQSEITKKIINSHVFPLALAVVYTYYIGYSLLNPSGGSFSTLAGVEKLFSKREALLAGWVHYLVFDMLVGAWEWRDALSNNVSHWILAPCLLLTLMLGPVGFLIYFVARYFLIGMPF